METETLPTAREGRVAMRLQERQSGFAAVLLTALERMRDASGADIVALYPYDAEADRFYAPVAIGLPETDLVYALPDLADQLRRFRVDEAQGKIPEDLLPSHYGPSAWLIARHRPLISADAYHDVDGSFVRRHKIHAIVGLPLMVGERIVALLYLNYVRHDDDSVVTDVTDPAYLERIETTASGIALDLDAARHAEELETLRTVNRLINDFSSLPDSADDGDALARRLETAVQAVLTAVGLDAAALYVAPPDTDEPALVAALGAPTLALHHPTLPSISLNDIPRDPALIDTLKQDGLSPLVALAPHAQQSRSVLLFADRDALTLQRRPPAVHTLLQTAADLLGNFLGSTHLLQALGESNRTLGAVTRLGARLLQPGATQQEALRTAAAALTDAALPELDFEFANLFLLDTSADGDLQVCESAGATASPAINSVTDDGTDDAGASIRRVPAWAGDGRRALGKRDVLKYVATRRRAVVVAARDKQHDQFIAGYPEDRLERFDTPILTMDGSRVGEVHAARLRESADQSPLRAATSDEIVYRVTDEFTLDADLFELHEHGSLVRVFMPFGHDTATDRATGVLEAGFHIAHRQRLERVQIEALRACVTILAVAVETARLYEEATRRAEQLQIITDVSRTIATSIDLEQTLHLIARNMARSVDASVCLIALLEEDDSAWYGAAASDSEDVWRTRRVERPERNIVFEVTDTERPLVVEDALNHPLVSNYFARLLDLRSLMVLPLLAGDAGAIGAVLLGQREHQRVFTDEEVNQASGLASQAAMAIRNARTHAREEEEQHVQKDVVLVGFGQWGQKAYKHLVLLKSFFNFRTHVVEWESPGRREKLAEAEQQVLANGDAFYWDSTDAPARNALALELEPSCYVITYIATPAETHLPLLKAYYELSNVVLIEKPLGAPPEEYRAFLDTTDGTVEIVAADHYWFKMEVRLLQLLLTEERNLRAFLDDIEEVEIEILEEQPPGGSGAQIGMIADLIPHAFAVLSLLTPLDRVKLDPKRPLQVGRFQPLHSEHETYARLMGSFDHRGRQVRVTIDVGKGVADAKWIKLSGERRLGGRRSFYKFDFSRGEAIDGTQSALRAANRPIRQPGVRDNAHLSMLRHVIEKKHPAVAILSIREALRANARVQELERMANDLLVSGQWTPYTQGQRPLFPDQEMLRLNPAQEASKEAIGQ
ncbi:MAG: hypothetical protein NVS4B2_05110 [Chloroflexota bacterium]